MSARFWICAALIGLMGVMSDSASAGANAETLLEPRWTYGFLGSLDSNPMVSADVDGDGKDEIVAASGSYDGSYVSVVDWPSGETWPRVPSVSPGFDGGIAELVVWPYQSGYRAAVGTYQGLIRVVDLTNMVTVAEVDFGSTIWGLAAGDVLGAGDTQLVACISGRTVIMDQDDLSILVETSETAAGVAAAEVDGDPNLELVFGDGRVVEIVDGTAVLEWVVPESSSALLVADLDEDGLHEIVFGTNDELLAFNFGVDTPMWVATPGISYDHPSTADLTGDGVPEVVYEYYGRLYGLHPTLGIVVWEHEYHSCDPKGAALTADLDGDGDLELMWPGPSLCMADPWSGDLLWRSEDSQGHGTAMAVASQDVDGDEDWDLVAVTGSGLLIFESGSQTPHLPRFGSGSYFYYNDAGTGLEVADADRDGVAEIVITNGRMIQVDPATMEIERTSTSVDGPVGPAGVADVDGDNWPEVLAVAYRYGSYGYAPLTISATEGATGEIEWVSDGLGNDDAIAGSFAVDNLNPAPSLEAVVVELRRPYFEQGRIHVLNTELQYSVSSSRQDYTGFGLADLAGNGTKRVVAGTVAGRVAVLKYDGANIFELWRKPVVDGAVVGVVVYRKEDGGHVAVIAADNMLTGVDLDTREVVWKTRDLGRDAGRYGLLALVDDPDLARPQIFVGSHSSIRLFDLVDLLPLFSDGFESGDTSAWVTTP